jgi:hypothetical protein
MRLHHDGSSAAWHACSQMILAELNSRPSTASAEGAIAGIAGCNG